MGGPAARARWRSGPSEAEQLAAVSQYAKYAIEPLCPQPERAQVSAGTGVAPADASRPSSELSRTSLLGRPLKVETHHRDLRYRKKQNIIYNFLERPHGWRAALYHFVL